MNQPQCVQSIIDTLKDVHGIKAIVLGGSWAAGVQYPDSDIDLGLYYLQKVLRDSSVTCSSIEE
jgi:predicted nucleotidyltransferase